jgi:alkylation response protein AidB-like acyl-CoA dehydrogenase
VHFELTDEQQLLRQAVERFAQDHCDPAQRGAHRACERGYSAENWRALADLGVLAMPFAASDGGLGGGRVELLTIMESLGRSLAIEPMLEEVILAGGLIARAGSPQQKEHWLHGLIAGEAHVTFAHFEHEMRFGLAGVGVRALSSGSAYVLNGHKSIVPLGVQGTAFVVSARESLESGQRIGLYLIKPDAKGLERRELRLVDGSVACALTMRDAVGERLPGGHDLFEQVADEVRIAAAAEMLGIMSRLFDTTLEHARTRTQFGAPLGSFQVIQHMLADLYVSLEQSRSQLYRAAFHCGNDNERRRAVAGMKSYVSTAALKLGEQCIQLYGGMGVSEELPVGDGHKRILLLSMLFGDADYHLDRYTRNVA